MLLLLLCLTVRPAAAAPLVNAKEPPVIPVGIDAYRQWDRWPYLRLGMRAYMRSTYDRRGGNEGADASHFLYQTADDRNVTLSVMGEGALVFARYNHWHGSPWHYTVDGRDTVVRETSTGDPEHPTAGSRFLPEAAFPNPLAWTWSDTKGADLSWVPIPFQRSLTMAYERTHYGTGYYIYDLFTPGMGNLSRPLGAWTPQDAPPADVLSLLRRSGTDLAPRGPGVTTLGGAISLRPGERRVLVAITKAPATICALKLSVPASRTRALERCWLRITWDGAREPSVAAPVPLLFGAGALYSRDGRADLVKALPVNVRLDPDRTRLAMYFPMPFLKSARVELVAPPDQPVTDLRWEVRTQPYRGPANWVAYFHATYGDHATPAPGRDLVLLDTTKVEGGGSWCGHFVGTSFIFSDRAVLSTLEGDPRFFFDDSQTPQAYGTGTEEWCGGGDYWGGRNMTLPLAGHPTGAPSAREARSEEDMVESAYRFLLADLMPFGRSARIQLEHGGTNESTEHYQSVTYWYGLHQACLKRTDTFHVGDTRDEKRHQYASPTASPVQTLSSRYEWGVDHLGDREIYPESTDTGRFMKGTSTFVLRLDPRNLGVLLRRKLDYAFPNQWARVLVADTRPGAPWRPAGVWYTAGSNTCVYSNPPGELGATQHIVQTSNRRWRDDEFLLPRALTQGRSALRVKVEFTPLNIPLFPGHPLGDQAWSEYRYTAYCYVMPVVEKGRRVVGS
jgi:hypothetical protein